MVALPTIDPVAPAAISATTLSPSVAPTIAPQDIAEAKRERVLELTLCVTGHCPICWFRGTEHDDHWAYHCPTQVAGESPSWKGFKQNLRLGPTVCYRCGLPFGSPCNHVRLNHGERASNLTCDYQDVLRELAFLIYTDSAETRDAVFARLQVRVPNSLGLFKHWLSRSNPAPGGLVNFVELLAAYWSLKSQG
jgi:hypothetical protein